MAFANAQTWKSNSATATTVAVGAGQGWAQPAAGDLIVAIGVSSLTPGTHTITGAALGAARATLLTTDNDMRVSVFAELATGAGEGTITLNSTASDNLGLLVATFTGVTAGWGFAATALAEDLGGADTTINPPQIVTTADAIIGAAAVCKVLPGGGGATWTGGFTASGANQRAQAAHLLPGAAGTFQPVGTINNASNWGALLFAITNPAAGGSLALGLRL